MKANVGHQGKVGIPVAPLVGAWIESISDFAISTNVEVAPLVGAWIESSSAFGFSTTQESRSSCRSVD